MPLDLTKALITGAGGTIGCYADFGTKLTRADMDITNQAEVSSVIHKYHPSAVIHCAALTDMRRCEEFPDDAHRVNVEGTKNVAEAAAEVSAVFVYLSTNAVFDGKKDSPYDETDAPHPLNQYGKSKYLGEQAVMACGGKWLIVRTAWMFGGGPSHDKRFVGKIISQLGQKEIKAVSDNRGTPTYAKDLVETIKRLLLKNARGLVHVTNSGTASRFDQATCIAKMAGYTGKIVPIGLKTLETAPSTLPNEALISKKAHLRDWHEALSEYLIHEFGYALR